MCKALRLGTFTASRNRAIIGGRLCRFPSHVLKQFPIGIWWLGYHAARHCICKAKHTGIICI